MTAQPSMTPDARRGGLEALRAVVRRNNPGFDLAIVEVEGADRVNDPAPRKIAGPLPAPEDPRPGLDRIDVSPATNGATDEHAIEEAGQDLPTVVGAEG